MSRTVRRSPLPRSSGGGPVPIRDGSNVLDLEAWLRCCDRYARTPFDVLGEAPLQHFVVGEGLSGCFDHQRDPPLLLRLGETGPRSSCSRRSHGTVAAAAHRTSPYRQHDSPTRPPCLSRVQLWPGSPPTAECGSDCWFLSCSSPCNGLRWLHAVHNVTLVLLAFPLLRGF